MKATGLSSKKCALAKIGLLHVWSCESKYPADPAPYSRLRDGGGLQILSGFAGKRRQAGAVSSGGDRQGDMSEGDRLIVCMDVFLKANGI